MKKKKRSSNDPKTLWQAMARERLYRFTMSDGLIRGAVIYANTMIREMQENHHLGILETLILGQAYMGVVLMTTNLKGADRIALNIDCSGSVKGLIVEANAFGEVRGYLKNPNIPIEKEMKDFNTSPFFGAGILSVTKTLEDSKNPFTGQVILKNGRIAKDLTYYYLKSEQIPSAFHLSVKFDQHGKVAGAGGLFLQVLPGAREKEVEKMEDKIAAMPSLGTVFSQGTKADDFIKEYFSANNLKMLGDRKTAFMCHCNEEKITRLLSLLPHDEFEDLRENGPFPLEAACHYCGTKYYIGKEKIDLLEVRRRNPN